MAKDVMKTVSRLILGLYHFYNKAGIVMQDSWSLYRCHVEDMTAQEINLSYHFGGPFDCAHKNTGSDIVVLPGMVYDLFIF